MVKINSLIQRLTQKSNPVLGLDAYGVIYNDTGVFEDIPAVFNYCRDQGIPIVMMTNNATQSIPIIQQKMALANLHLDQSHIISSGCGLHDLPELKALINQQSTFVYGYDSSRQYAIDGGARIVAHPNAADVIVMAASVGSQNHHVYRSVYLSLKHRPECHVICINPDHYVSYRNGFMTVMGYYANQLAHQLQRPDFIWMGKPYPLFSDLTKHRFEQLGYDPTQLVFCDDNPHNVLKIHQDLNCDGVVITQTGIFTKVPPLKNGAGSLFQIPKCKI
ncbi:MAG: hypothetical protein VW397_05520 [Candidatus Margulisiibacteriota bacterium]